MSINNRKPKSHSCDTLSYYLTNCQKITRTISDTSISNLSTLTDDSDDDLNLDHCVYPLGEKLANHEQLLLKPSHFPAGCICGHGIHYRENYVCKNRNGVISPRSHELTIYPHIKPLMLNINYSI